MNQVSFLGTRGVVLNWSPPPGFVFSLPCSSLPLRFAQTIAINLKPLHFGLTAMKRFFCICSLLAWRSATPIALCASLYNKGAVCVITPQRGGHGLWGWGQFPDGAGRRGAFIALCCVRVGWGEPSVLPRRAGCVSPVSGRAVRALSSRCAGTQHSVKGRRARGRGARGLQRMRVRQ